MTTWAIETTSLTRRFGNLTAVDRLNLQVPVGSVFGFLGPNGAGKTTTIRMLLGLIRPDEGGVRLLGVDLRANRVALAANIGALVETPSLYPHLTGYENLEVTRRLIGSRRTQIDRALRIVQLSQAAGTLVSEYSLGMRQRLALALALLNEPTLLILDEPTNGLDPAGIHEIRDLIRSSSSELGLTVFLSSHLLSEVEQLATHVAILSRGTVIFQGSLPDLKAQRQAHIVLGVDRPEEAARDLVQAGWVVQPREDGRLSIIAKGHTSAAEINTLLVRQGFAVDQLSTEHPSLESVFLQLTTESATASGTR